LAVEKPLPIAGGIGIGTWNTSAEFKDVSVVKNGQVLYASDFLNGAEGWKPNGGSWSVVDGAYRQSAQAVGLSYFGDPNWSDYTLTVKARKISGPEGFLVAFGRKSEERNWWNIGGWGNHEHAIELNQNSIGKHVPGVIETNRLYDVKIELNERRIRCYLDGKLVHDEIAVTPKRVFASAGVDEVAGELVLKVINADPEPLKASVKLDGVDHLGREAQITVLASEKPSDNNSMDNPAKIVPVASRATVDGPDFFSHDFPPNSFTLIRVKGKPASASKAHASGN